MANTGKFTKGMRTARRSTSRFSKTAGLARRAVGALGVTLGAAGIVYALKKAIQSFVAFEKQLAMVSTMLDEGTMKHMAEYKRGLEELSVSMGESTETLSKGLYDILSASVAPAKAMKVLAVAAKAAKGGMTDTAIAADAVTTILNSYSLAADQAADVSDWLFAVVKRGKLTFAELAGSVGKAASLAATAGMKLEEFGAAIATITRGGMRTEEAMTGVNAIIKGFIAPTTEAKMAAAKLGIDLSSLTLKTLGLANVLEELEGVSPEVLMKIFPNVRAIKALAVLRQNLQGLKTDIDALGERTGKAEEAYKKMAQTAATEWAKTGQQWQQVLRDVGTATEPVARGFARLGQLFSSTFTAIPKDVLDVLPAQVKVSAAAERRAREAAKEAWAAIRQRVADAKAVRALDLPTHRIAEDWAKAAQRARVEATVSADRIAKLTNMRAAMLGQIQRLQSSERDILIQKLATLKATGQETQDILAIHDRIAKTQKSLAAGREMKAFARGMREWTQTPLQQLEEFRKKLKEAVLAGALPLHTAIIAFQKRARELQTPAAAGGDPGQFRAIRSAFMDIRGMAGGKSAEVSELERIRAVNEHTNRLIEEKLGAGLN